MSPPSFRRVVFAAEGAGGSGHVFGSHVLGLVADVRGGWSRRLAAARLSSLIAQQLPMGACPCICTIMHAPMVEFLPSRTHQILRVHLKALAPLGGSWPSQAKNPACR